MNKTTAALIARLARRARREAGIKINRSSSFGDCVLVSNNLIALVKWETDLEVERMNGHFLIDPKLVNYDELFEHGDYATVDGLLPHTWVKVEGLIVDPTVDQMNAPAESLFHASIIAKLFKFDTVVRGVYVQHPAFDGDTFANHYKKRQTPVMRQGRPD